MIFLPLQPSFEGDISDTKNALLRIYVKNIWSTISRGPTSLLQLLKEEDGIPDPTKYIKFYSLR